MKITGTQAKVINTSILVGGIASGLLSDDPSIWYRCFLDTFLLIMLTVFPTALIIYCFSLIWGKRIQYNNPEKPKLVKEVIETTSCFFVVACMVAWPLKRFRQGHLKAYVWDIEESTPGSGILPNLVYLLISFLVVDVYTYWKHRLLHTKMFFVFHADHHQFHDPTPLGGFAVSPVEAVLTFGLLLFDCLPQADLIKFYFPLHSVIIIGFTVLNLYLHAGYTFSFIEVTLPKLFINTSGYHNLHHSKGNTHFGELLTLWDYLLKTGNTYYNPAVKVK